MYFEINQRSIGYKGILNQGQLECKPSTRYLTIPPNLLQYDHKRFSSSDSSSSSRFLVLEHISDEYVTKQSDVVFLFSN